MPKFFVCPDGFSGNTIRIHGRDAKHIAVVLRKKPGDHLSVCNSETGQDYLAIITALSPAEVLLTPLSEEQSVGEPSIDLALFLCFLKGDKMEFVIEKSVELGVSKIVPVFSERCIVRLDDAAIKKRHERFKKTAEAAAKQCGRGRIPELSLPISLSEAPAQMALFDQRAVCYEAEKTCSFRDLPLKEARRFALLTGPEGGFSAEEVALLAKGGVPSVSLGPRILRAETAPIAALTILLYETHNMDPLSHKS